MSNIEYSVITSDVIKSFDCIEFSKQVEVKLSILTLFGNVLIKSDK